MVKGFASFQKWFTGFEKQYAIIGGTACDLLMMEEQMDFRATRDIDLVLIVEALTPDFGRRFWEYIEQAGYEHRNKSTNEPQFYRFQSPASSDYPAMIELFSRRLDAIALPPEAALTPVPMEEEISSLSAILLDDVYYQFLRTGGVVLDGVTVLDAAHLIPFKAKAWLDLSARKEAGEAVDGKNIRKHKNDIFRLSVLLTPNAGIETPREVFHDMQNFLEAMQAEEVDLKQLGVQGKKEQILQRIAAAYAQKKE